LCTLFAILLQCTRMSDDSKLVKTEEAAVAESTIDSFTTNSIMEIVPLDNAFDDNHIPEFLHPVHEVKPESLTNTNQEPADEFAVSTSLPI